MMKQLKLWLLLATVVLATTVLVTAQDERLNNPGLEEGSFGAYTTRRGGEFPIYVPSSWNVWLAGQSGDFINRGDRTAISPHPGPAPDPREGSRALNISCGFFTCTIAIYQQVSVTQGANIQASAQAQVKACNLPKDGTTCGSAVESGAKTRIGIDPNGGTDPNDGDIIWSNFVEPHDRWEQMSVSATTTGTTATLFLYSTQGSPADLNRTYWDQTSLKGGGSGNSSQPGATAVPPTPTPIPEVAFVVPQNSRPDGSIVHNVQAGDTMDSIAFAYQITRTELLELNPDLNRGSILRVGQEILIRQAQAQPEPTAEPATPEPPAPDTSAEQPVQPDVSSPAINLGGDLQASVVQLGVFGAGSGTILIGQSPEQTSFDLNLIPVLNAPEGVEVRTSDTSANGKRAALSTATLISELTPEQIIVTYNEQFETLGWQPGIAEALNGFAWSTWTFTDGEGTVWGSTLTITSSPTNPGQYTVTLQIKEAG